MIYVNAKSTKKNCFLNPFKFNVIYSVRKKHASYTHLRSTKTLHKTFVEYNTFRICDSLAIFKYCHMTSNRCPP